MWMRRALMGLLLATVLAGQTMRAQPAPPPPPFRPLAIARQPPSIWADTVVRDHCRWSNLDQQLLILAPWVTWSGGRDRMVKALSAGQSALAAADSGFERIHALLGQWENLTDGNNAANIKNGGLILIQLQQIRRQLSAVLDAVYVLRREMTTVAIPREPAGRPLMGRGDWALHLHEWRMDWYQCDRELTLGQIYVKAHAPDLTPALIRGQAAVTEAGKQLDAIHSLMMTWAGLPKDPQARAPKETEIAHHLTELFRNLNEPMIESRRASNALTARAVAALKHHQGGS